MLTGFLSRAVFFSSKIKISELKSKTYDELVDLVANRYGNKEFKHPNTAALYQIQHHFNVITPGDWILDIGAGPSFRWTDLALSLAENQEGSHRVIANDKQQRGIIRPNSFYVGGNFMQEQVRTKIALALGQKKFDTILADVSPAYTGQLESDGAALNQMLYQTFYFSSLFLKKGGNIVCKVLRCNSTSLLDETGKLFFHEAYSYKPSVLRLNSPVFFLVFKGFGMNHNLQALQEFLKKYRGSAKNKIQVVREYQGKYSWDPVNELNIKAKNDYAMLRMQGRSPREIQNMYRDDPFVKIAQIAKKFSMIEKAREEKNQIGFRKAVSQFTDGKFYSDYEQIPNSREEWITFLQGVQQRMNMMRQAKKKKKKNNGPRQNLEPLGDNQIYMKQSGKVEQPPPEYLYIEEDLTAEYDAKNQEVFVERQLAKLQQAYQRAHPNEKLRDHNRNGKIDLRKVFGWGEGGKDPIKEVNQLSETLRAMSDDEYKEQLQKEEGYHQQIQNNVGRSVKGSRTKFRNR